MYPPFKQFETRWIEIQAMLDEQAGNTSRRSGVSRGMRTPKVTEIKPRPQPVAHDTFIDDLRR